MGEIQPKSGETTEEIFRDFKIYLKITKMLFFYFKHTKTLGIF